MSIFSNPGGATRFFWVWLTLRTLVWLAAIVVSHPNGPLDLIEWLSWGREWQWGSAKHPPLPAWIADLFARLSPGDVWGVYLAGYLATAGCLLAAWQLGRRYLPETQVLLACLCLDGLMYATNDPAEFSNNVMLNLGWAWLIVWFDRAAYGGKLSSWAAVGVAAGLTLLCKYTVGVLFIVFLAYLLTDRTARRSLRTPGPYLAIALALFVVWPHFQWLRENQFITFRYALERSTESEITWTRHLFNPAIFVVGQALALLPVVIILLPLLSLRRQFKVREAEPLTTQVQARPNLRYLHFVVLGPVILLLALSLATGCLLREIWGSPLWTFMGVWLLATFGKSLWQPALRRSLGLWLVIALAMMAFTLTKQIAGPFLTGKAGRPQFPGRQLAIEVNRRWEARYGGVPLIIGGEPWRAGNVCCYSRHRPSLYSSGAMNVPKMIPADTPWVNDEMMNRLGGVILWDANADGDQLRLELRERFPRAEVLEAIELPYETRARIPPTRIGAAFVPPR